VRERDGVYQQVVWPWLMGLLGEAWLRVSQLDTRAKQQARTRFLVPMLQSFDQFGDRQLPEIADGRRSPYAAWLPVSGMVGWRGAVA
jgi:hypothetical protein